MKVLVLSWRFFEISVKVTGAGMVGVYFIGWKRVFPISWIWAILSSIGGFIASCRGVELFKIIIVSFAWPVAFWFILGVILGFAVSIYEAKSKRVVQ